MTKNELDSVFQQCWDYGGREPLYRNGIYYWYSGWHTGNHFRHTLPTGVHEVLEVVGPISFPTRAEALKWLTTALDKLQAETLLADIGDNCYDDDGGEWEPLGWKTEVCVFTILFLSLLTLFWVLL